MLSRGSNAPRSNAFKPHLEEMEARWVPDAAGAVGNIFNIASQAILYQAAVGNLKAALPAAVQNAAIANQLKQAAGQIANASATNREILQQSGNELGKAAGDIINNLNAQFSKATSDTIIDLNAQVTALQAQVDRLPPEQRAAAQAALASTVFTLADGAQIRLRQFQDFVGGQQRAVVTFLSGIVPQYTITLGRTIAAEQEARQIEAIADALDDGAGGGTNTGQGTFIKIGLVLAVPDDIPNPPSGIELTSDGSIALFGLDTDNNGRANGDDTYVKINGEFRLIDLDASIAQRRIVFR